MSVFRFVLAVLPPGRVARSLLKQSNSVATPPFAEESVILTSSHLSRNTRGRVPSECCSPPTPPHPVHFTFRSRCYSCPPAFSASVFSLPTAAGSSRSSSNSRIDGGVSAIDPRKDPCRRNGLSRRQALLRFVVQALSPQHRGQEPGNGRRKPAP